MTINNVPPRLTPQEEAARQADEVYRSRIADPTMKVTLPTSMLRALAETHRNLVQQLDNLRIVLDHTGWPEGRNREDYAVPTLVEDAESLTTALDYARRNVELTWVLIGLTSDLGCVVGAWEPPVMTHES